RCAPPAHRPACARRSAVAAGKTRSATMPCGRAALLRWPLRGGNRADASDQLGDREARMGHRPPMVAAATGRQPRSTGMSAADSANWARVKDILGKCLELRLDERGAYLDRVCAGDTSLRADVQSLLAHEDRTGGFLDAAPVPPASWIAHSANGTAADALASWIGERIGQYRVVALIAHGGMGVVYRG